MLAGLFVWNMVVLFGQKGGSYGGYPIWAQVIAGWALSVLVFASGFIAKAVVVSKKKKGYVEDEVNWDKPAELSAPAAKKAVAKNGQKKRKKK